MSVECEKSSLRRWLWRALSGGGVLCGRLLFLLFLFDTLADAGFTDCISQNIAESNDTKKTTLFPTFPLLLLKKNLIKGQKWVMKTYLAFHNYQTVHPAFFNEL